MAPANVADRQRDTKSGRLDRGRNQPDLGGVAVGPGPGWQRVAIQYLHAEECPIYEPSPVAGHDDRLLTEKTTLRIANRPNCPGYLHDEPVLNDVPTVHGSPGFDAERLPCLFASECRPGGS